MGRGALEGIIRTMSLALGAAAIIATVTLTAKEIQFAQVHNACITAERPNCFDPNTFSEYKGIGPDPVAKRYSKVEEILVGLNRILPFYERLKLGERVIVTADDIFEEKDPALRKIYITLSHGKDGKGITMIEQVLGALILELEALVGTNPLYQVPLAHLKTSLGQPLPSIFYP